VSVPFWCLAIVRWTKLIRVSIEAKKNRVPHFAAVESDLDLPKWGGGRIRTCAPHLGKVVVFVRPSAASAPVVERPTCDRSASRSHRRDPGRRRKQHGRHVAGRRTTSFMSTGKPSIEGGTSLSRLEKSRLCAFLGENPHQEIAEFVGLLVMRRMS
jgi:hypothetical protein